MLYEKALSRKVVSISSTPEDDDDDDEEENEDDHTDAALNGNGATKHKPKSTSSKVFAFITNRFRSKKVPVKVKMSKKARWLASMGKIYNLLR